MQAKSTYDPTTGELLSDSFEIQTVEKFDAQRSMHSGETRPDYLNSGDFWIKTKNGIATGIYQWFESNGAADGKLIAMIPSTDSDYQAGVSVSTSVTPKQVKGDINRLDDLFENTPHVVSSGTPGNGSSWWKIWSDGFIEQGNSTLGDEKSINFMIPFTTTTYTMQLSCYLVAVEGVQDHPRVAMLTEKRTTGFSYVQERIDLITETTSTLHWVARGY